MEISRDAQQDEVWNHWKTVEGWTDDTFRSDIRDRLPPDLIWFLTRLEIEDINSLFIISSDDWKDERLCDPNFKLMTAITNFSNTQSSCGKYGDIHRKEALLSSNQNGLNTKLILVSSSQEGPFTIIEGNRRAVALGKLGMLVGLDVFCGISTGVNDYYWARYSFGKEDE